MSAAETALDQFNQLVEQASRMAVDKRIKLDYYLKVTNDPPHIRERRINHVLDLELQYKGLVHFRQQFQQSLLDAVANISHTLSRDVQLKGAFVWVERSTERYSNSNPFKVKVHFL